MSNHENLCRFNSEGYRCVTLLALSIMLLLSPITTAAAVSIDGPNPIALASVANDLDLASRASELGPKYYLKTVLMLMLVLVAIFVVVYFFSIMQRGIGGQTRGMKVIAQLSLSAKERIVLVKLGERAILLGVSPGRIEALQFFSEMPTLDAENSENDFGKLLQHFYKKVRHA